MTTLPQDLTYGFRMLFTTPAFAVAAVLSLALGSDSGSGRYL